MHTMLNCINTTLLYFFNQSTVVILYKKNEPKAYPQKIIEHFILKNVYILIYLHILIPYN